MIRTTTRVAALSAAMFALLFAGSAPDLSARLSADLSAVASAKPQPRTQPQDLAGKLSGTWVFNRELSSGFGAPGRGRPPSPSLRRPSGEPRPRALFASTAFAIPQRGGGGAGATDAGDATPEQRAEQAAMRLLQQIDARITIKAAGDSITFTDTRGERTYAITDKSSEIFVASSPVRVKSKWDKQALKQEFTNPQAKLVQTWSIDGSDHLVLTAKVESLKLVTPERKAVFDRQ